MKIEEFVCQHSNASPNADIVERWENRVVPQGLDQHGRAGAQNYIAKYLKGAKAPKVIGFARLAELKGRAEMAAGFWEEAFFLTTGVRARLGAFEANSTTEVIPAPILRSAFGTAPQLLVPLTREVAMSLVHDRRYGIQEKVDGERIIVRKTGPVITAGNKKGLVRDLPVNLQEALARLPDFEIDAEIVGTKLFAFDHLAGEGSDTRSLPYQHRFIALSLLFASVEDVAVVRLATTLADKIALVKSLEDRGAEGFVLKRFDAPYVSGDAHGTQWKHQFRGTAAVLVGSQNGTKSSVEVFVHRPDGTLRSMGNVTIPGRTLIPACGAIIEVEYLYCHPGHDGKFAQPVFKGVRTDADPADCQDSKLRVKDTAVAA